MKNNHKRFIIAIIFMSMFCVGMASFGLVNFTLAWLSDSSSSVTEFTKGDIDCVVLGNFEDKLNPSDVVVKNIGSIPAYMRVMMALNWVDSDGVVMRPEKVDEEQLLLNGDWNKGEDGYYYYKYPLKPNEESSNLIDIYSVEGNEDELTLEIVIEVSAIQANPEEAVKEVWNVGENLLMPLN